MFGLARQRGVRQEPQRAQSVVETHDDHTTTSQVRPIDAGQRDRPEVESATVDPHHDGEPVAAGLRRSPDVERETVFACGSTQAQGTRARGRRPRTSGSEPGRISHVGPLFGRRGWAPSTVAGWRSGVRNTLERHDVSPTASHRPGLRVNRCRDWLRRLSVYDGKSERDGHQLQDPAHR